MKVKAANGLVRILKAEDVGRLLSHQSRQHFSRSGGCAHPDHAGRTLCRGGCRCLLCASRGVKKIGVVHGHGRQECCWPGAGMSTAPWRRPTRTRDRRQLLPPGTWERGAGTRTTTWRTVSNR